MALKSGHMAYLAVPPNVIAGVHKFLDTVQSQNGAAYGYSGPGEGKATSAIGLLCRMYTGWDRTNPGISTGVKRLERWTRPSQGLYFYYYATQVMHHYRGNSWHKWNDWMRDYLVNTQDRTDGENGSWRLTGSFDDGRLYCTAMATMTLEVYYRYSPIYGYDAVPATTDE